MEASFWPTVFLLFAIIDPLGLLPVSVSLLRPFSPRRRTWIILREIVIAFLILLLFMFFGANILNALGLNNVSLAIAGGVVLLLIAVRMIFPVAEGIFGPSHGEPFLVPLAVPLLAGPSAMATVLLLMSREPGQAWTWIGALSLTMLLCAIILVFGDWLSKFLQHQILTALERLMGLVLLTISVQMILEGIEKFVHAL